MLLSAVVAAGCVMPAWAGGLHASPSAEERPVSDIGTESRLAPGEFDIACAPRGDGAYIYRAPSVSARDAALSARVGWGWSFNITRLYDTPDGQMASGVAHDGRWTRRADDGADPVDAHTEPQFYILTRAWECDLYEQ
ncbi:hypothetical protein KAJ83_13010 [Marivibrio halodurans]|uniref:Uncharacterized protein n=1 Tax=Marivibrio halodurans TaxID=2039722 RepID=A0A8J7S9I8_9PROT|nr:hypothetical protein [Marivibrio halodurans]MBP5857932.1 hypothetical protein [Marivibrio halodurans]